VDPVYKSSISDDTHKFENHGFNPMVIRIEKPPEGIPVGVRQVDYYLYTDSNSIGYGPHLVYQTGRGKELHINVLELKAIWLGLQAVLDTTRGRIVAIMCDNISAITYLSN
jgi:hypothetical protein